MGRRCKNQLVHAVAMAVILLQRPVSTQSIGSLAGAKDFYRRCISENEGCGDADWLQTLLCGLVFPNATQNSLIPQVISQLVGWQLHFHPH